MEIDEIYEIYENRRESRNPIENSLSAWKSAPTGPNASLRVPFAEVLLIGRRPRRVASDSARFCALSKFSTSALPGGHRGGRAGAMVNH